jgi:MoaA/NifB/PqqE/SkfB family radical SAM enzyme
MKKRYLLRKEYFGGTLFDRVLKKRNYITREDFEKIELNSKSYILDSGNIIDLQDSIIARPQILHKNSFSAPDKIYIEINRKCNLFCKHCYNDSSFDFEQGMKIDDIKRLINEALILGTQEVRFTGGEPLLFDGILELIKFTSSNGLWTTLGTNGTLLTEKLCKNLDLCGLDQIIVSLDGDEKTNDSIRGIGSFRATLNGLLTIKKVAPHIDCKINMTVMKTNVKTIAEVKRIADSIGGSMNLRRFMPIGRGDLECDEILTFEEYINLNTSEFLVNTESIKSNNQSINSSYMKLPFVRRSCKIGQRSLAFDDRGNVLLCGFLRIDQPIQILNINEYCLEEIWKIIIEEVNYDNIDNEIDRFNMKYPKMFTNCYANVCSYKKHY